jgi:hypothetical protein
MERNTLPLSCWLRTLNIGKAFGTVLSRAGSVVLLSLFQFPTVDSGPELGVVVCLQSQLASQEAKAGV